MKTRLRLLVLAEPQQVALRGGERLGRGGRRLLEAPVQHVQQGARLGGFGQPEDLLGIRVGLRQRVTQERTERGVDDLAGPQAPDPRAQPRAQPVRTVEQRRP